MRDNIIQLAPRGVQTPRYRAQQIRQDRDPDLFINMINSHPGHLARAKAKRDRVIEAALAKAAAEQRSREEQDRLAQNLAQVSVGSMLALTLTAALAL